MRHSMPITCFAIKALSCIHSTRYSLGRIILIVQVCLLSACANLSNLPGKAISTGIDTNAELRACFETLQKFDRQVKAANISDSQVLLLSQYPYLAIDRFLASYQWSALDIVGKREWIELAGQLAEHKRALEFANLPGHLVNKSKQDLRSCNKQLIAAHAVDIPIKQAEIVFPSNYRLLPQIIGLYPLSRLFVLPRLHANQELARSQFQRRFDASNAKLYQPQKTSMTLSEEQITAMFHSARERSALGVARLTPEESKQLFEHYAPQWWIETRSPSDIPGRLIWSPTREAQIPSLINDQVTVYTLKSNTHFYGETLVQLNYFVWFKDRPRKSTWDIYAGQLDGLIWRVTLDAKGQPLVYDSIHPCGCYHQFFPVQAGLQEKASPSGQEPALILDREIPDARQHAVTVQITAGDHRIAGLTTAAPPAVPREYILKDYDQLRSMPLALNSTVHQQPTHRSIFNTKGMVKGTQRLERFLLWPMGIPSAGMMRQWGHHATAFLGKRHFDDPFLLERIFLFQKSTDDTAQNRKQFTITPTNMH